MKVRFINKTNFCLTEGKSYKVLSRSKKFYIIKDNNGNKVHRFKHVFEIIPSKQLKVGDRLSEKNLNDWCKVDQNEYRDVWQTLVIAFIGDRKIKAIDIKDGFKAFLVSGTLGVWIRAKGYRKFCERNETPIVTGNSAGFAGHDSVIFGFTDVVVTGSDAVMLGYNNRLIEESEQ